MDSLFNYRDLRHLQSMVSAFRKSESFGDVACPGLYCGRIQFDNGSLSECGQCPRGFRPNKDSICTMCTSSLPPYDWMYLLCMAIVPLLMNLTAVDLVYRRSRSRYFAYMMLLVLTESTVASLATVSIFSENRSLGKIRSCRVERMADWYPLFHNPSPDYVNSLRCAQEAVFPLYSMVFVFVFFSFLFTIVFRGIFARIVWGWEAKNSLMCSLYQYPVLLVTHAVSAGVIYYCFPYLSIGASVIVGTSRLSSAVDHSINKIIAQWKNLLNDLHRIAVILVNWLLLAFGVVALAILHDIPLDRIVLFLPLIPVPTLLFLLTLKFTEPKKFFKNFDRS